MMIPAVWTGMYAERPLSEALRLLNECGWKHFEVSSEHLVQIEKSEPQDALIQEIVGCAQERGLSMPQAHLRLAADVAHPDNAQRAEYMECLKRHIEIAARLGVKIAVAHPGGKNLGNYTTTAQRKQLRETNVRAFRELADHAADHGLRIGLENLPRRWMDTPADLLELLQAIDHPAVGITLDTSHAQVMKLDIPAAVCEFGPHLIATHISDSDGSGDQHLTPGGGTIDWPPVMQALRDINYDGLFNLEIPGERHAVPELRKLKTEYAYKITEWLLRLAQPNS